MVFWFLIGVVLLSVASFLARWYVNAPTAQARQAAKLALGLAVGGVALLLLTRTGLPLLVGGLVSLAPMLLGLRAALRRAKAGQGPRAGGASTVMSAWFEMSLNHDTGDISGRIRRGANVGRALDDLDEAELDALAAACRGDMNSSRLLSAYMARRFGRDEAANDFDGEDDASARNGRSGGMTEGEALAVLGLEAGAGVDAINAAYRRLIALAHPDRGGSAYLAAQVNSARDLLLHRR